MIEGKAMTNADRIKQIRTAAAVATFSTLPAVVRSALAASVELLADYETRLKALEKKINGE